MLVSESFSKGWEVYKKNFYGLLVLNAIRLVALLGFALLAVLLFFLFLPDMPHITLGGMVSVMFYGLSLLALFIVASPVFLYPHFAGSVLALSKRLKAEWALELLREKYFKLIIDTLIYWAVFLFLVVESLFLMMGSPFLGTLLFLVAVYVAVRLNFWDVLVFAGEEHPIMASWRLTEGRFWQSFLFVVVANITLQVLLFVPMLGFFLCFLAMPFITSSKAVFATKGFNKKRR